MTLHIENHKYATEKLLELIDEFSKITEHKINTQKSLKSLRMEDQKQKFKKQSYLAFH